jgi:3-(3-hydroxy-phenyl)propionate hydroxylase
MSRRSGIRFADKDTRQHENLRREAKRVQQKHYDVMIAGYGPVGAVLANQLGRDGLSVLAIDRMADIFDKPRAINIDHEVMRTLQSVGLADQIEPKTILHPGTDFVGLDGRLIKVFEPVSPPYPLHWAPNLMFIQPEFEPVIRAGAEAHPTVEVRLETNVVNVEQDDNEVSLLLEKGGQHEWVKARYLVAADGATSGLRKRLGIGQDSLDFDEWWTVIDAWLKAPTALPRRTTQFCLPSSPVTYVVGPKALRRWEIKLLPGEKPEDFNDLAVVRKRLSPFVDLDALDLWRVATYRFHALVAQRWRVKRIFLAGDAAHQMPPFLAQGLCSGIRDVANLGWKLSGVLKGLFPESILDTYQQERKPHIEQLVAIAKYLGEIIGELDIERAKARDARLGDELDAGRAETIRQKFIPDLTAGLLHRNPDGTVASAAGSLFPQPIVKSAADSAILLDDVVGERFLVLTRGDATHVPDLVSAIERLGGIHLHLMAPPAASVPAEGEIAEEANLLSSWLDRSEATAVIVRPDKHVFGVAKTFADLSDQLQALAGSIFHPLPQTSARGFDATTAAKATTIIPAG